MNDLIAFFALLITLGVFGVLLWGIPALVVWLAELGYKIWQDYVTRKRRIKQEFEYE